MNLIDYVKEDLELMTIVEQEYSPDLHAHYYDCVDKDGNAIEVKVVHDTNDIYARLQNSEDWNLVSTIHNDEEEQSA